MGGRSGLRAPSKKRGSVGEPTPSAEAGGDTAGLHKLHNQRRRNLEGGSEMG